MSSPMNPLLDSFQKELGTRLAQGVSLALVVVFSAAAYAFPPSQHTARVILACLAILSFIALAVGLIIRRRGYHPDRSWPGTMTRRSDPSDRICHHCYVTKDVALPLIWDPDNQRWGCSGCHTQLNKP